MNNNNEQGSAGTPQERAAVPKGFVLVPIVAGLDEFTDRSIRDHADFREDVEILSTESNRKRLKIIRKDIYDTIDARVRHAVTAALAAAQPTPSKEGEQVGGAQATPLKNTRLDILSEIEDVLRAVYDDAASAHRFRAQGGNTQGESVAPTPSGSASVDTLEFRKLLNAAFAHRGVEGSKETVGNLIAHIESLIAARVATAQGMADCMDMVREELIEAGIIDKKTAPMFITEAVMRHIAGVRKDADTAAAHDVFAERQRQKEVEGWNTNHDDGHDCGEMASAAACYALHTEPVGNVGDYLRFWPWDSRWWKPRDRRHNLVRAGALILAEIERWDRAAMPAHSPATSSKEGGAV